MMLDGFDFVKGSSGLIHCYLTDQQTETPCVVQVAVGIK